MGRLGKLSELGRTGKCLFIYPPFRPYWWATVRHVAPDLADILGWNEKKRQFVKIATSD